MNEIPNVRNINVTEKNVLVRADLEGDDNSLRLQATQKIIEYLQEHNAKEIKIIGHKGKNYPNLRDDPREEANELSLAAELSGGFDVYINEAFATSHRKHCSIDALPRLMRQQGKEVGIGLRFEEEITHLSVPSLYQREGKGRVLVVGGAKSSDKAKYADELEAKGWKVVRGGLLPGVELRPDGLDISDKTIINYQLSIINSKTIVVAGPMGKFEDPNAEKGTREVFTAVAKSSAYKVAGGGDTEAALAKFGLTQKFDWISVGGGAMLEYLSSGTLVGIEAVID